MSHASGQIFENFKVIGYFEYNGTADIARTKVYKTFEEMWANWRKSEPEPCKCEGTDVLLYTNYANGFNWPGKICKEHGFITAGIILDGVDTKPGIPVDSLKPVRIMYVQQMLEYGKLLKAGTKIRYIGIGGVLSSANIFSDYVTGEIQLNNEPFGVELEKVVQIELENEIIQIID